MFGKNKEKIQALDTRILHNAKLTADDHHNLQEVMVQISTLQMANEELVDKVATLESKQEDLLAGLRGLGTKPSTPDFTIDDPALD